MNNSPSGKVYVPAPSCGSSLFSQMHRKLPVALRPIRPAGLLAAALVLVAPLAALAQRNAVPVRVTDRVDLSRLTTLTGSKHPLAQTRYDQGAAPPDLAVNRILLLLKRSPEQESALQDLLNQQQITSSSNYHKWLTPDQFGQQFGVADADIQAVTSWLASFGFQSIHVARGKNLIEFSGTAGQVEAGLHTAIHKYVVKGENHWANASDPQIPAALAPVIAGIVSLNDFHPRPASIQSGQKLTATVKPGGRPQLNLSGGGHALVPADFNTIYNIASNMTGNGVTIAILSDSNINTQDVADFRSMWSLAPKNPNVILNGPDPGRVAGKPAETEAVLDATWSGAVAPQANVDLVVSEDTAATAGPDLSEFYVIDNNLAEVMTESFQACESQLGSGLSAFATFYASMAEQAAAQGITFAVSSGDGGPDSCDDPGTIPNPPAAASVNILAATPFNVAVGGTKFNEGSNSSTYWNATNNQTTGGSALTYIPEEAWNESCTALSATCNIVGIWSSGGGISSIFSKPPWQAGVAGLPITTFRTLPDVAMTAANHDGYVLCIDQSCEGVGCPQQGTPCFLLVSGTSASVQVFGGVMALVVQKMGGRVGLANYALYKLAAGPNQSYPNCNGSGSPALIPATDNCIFNDVTVGNTNIPGESGFTAGAVYDKTTGLGSVNVSNLVNNWHTAVMEGTTTTLTLNNGNPVNVVHGTAVPVSLTVSPIPPATGTPTGDVSLIANSSTDLGVDCFPLPGGSSNCNPGNSTILLPGGTYQVHAHYGGDGTFLGSDSTPPVSVTVRPEPSQILIGITTSTATTCSLPQTIAYGSPYVLTGVVSDLNVATNPCAPNETGSSPTGTVTLTDSFNGGPALALDGGSFKLNSFGYFEDKTIQLFAGTHNITANYSGDNSFSPPTFEATDIITVTPAATTTAVTASQTTVTSGTPVTLTATVSTQSNATASASQEPTGNVQFLLNGSNFGSPVAVTGGVNSTTTFAQATATITPTLASGQNVITVQYLGDSNYAASAASPSVTVTVNAGVLNVSAGCTSSTISISAPGQSGSCQVNVTGPSGFAGTVTLSEALTNSPVGAVDPPSCSLGAPASQNFTAPGTLTLSASSESGFATMSCATMAASRVLLPVADFPFAGERPLAGAAISLACLFLLIGARKSPRWKFVSFAAVLVAVAFTAVSCGGGGSSGTTNPGTTKGAYTFTVTATPSTGAAQTATITVNVQ